MLEEVVSIGGLIFIDGMVQAFGCEVPQSLADPWKVKADQTQVIGQAGIFPVLLAKLTWQHLLEDRNVMYFIDNDAARPGLIKACSPSLLSLRLIMDRCNFDFQVCAQSWYARVPSASNISDGPSRLDFELVLRELKATRVEPKFPSYVRKRKNIYEF